MKYTVIIPARYASTRLPGKPLADICGKSMVQRAYEQAKKSNADRVIVATDNVEIEKVVKGFGGDVVMTRNDHESGTDRLAEVVDKLNLADDEIVVNVQGDEPLIPPSVIEQVAKNLHTYTDASIASVSEAIKNTQQYLDANAVKVVSDTRGIALYFSRAPIPWHRDVLVSKNEEDINSFLLNSQVQKHIGIYAYRVNLLKYFVSWPVADIEKIEKLEQLRAMANGHKIHIEEAVEAVPVGIDTPEDLELARAYFSKQEH